MSALSIKVKVADRVANQQPDFIQRDHPDFIKFLEAYYEFMEQNGGPLNLIRETIDNFDVDNAPDEFVDLLKHQVFPASLDNVQTAIDERELIKNLRDLYLTKGTEESFNFIMEKIYANSAKLDYGKKYVFRTSDNDYQGSYEMIVANLTGDVTDLSMFLGSQIVQRSSAATAIIDSIEVMESSVVRVSITGDITEGSTVIQNASDITNIRVGDILGYSEYSSEASHHHYHLGNSLFFPIGTRVVSINGNNIVTDKPAQFTKVGADLNFKTAYYKYILDKKSVNNPFDQDVNAIILDRDGETTVATVDIVSTIVNVAVTTRGSLYQSGAGIKVIDGSGTDTVLQVHGVSDGSIEGAVVIDGGTGYAVGDQFEVVPLDGYGKDGIVEVVAVDGYGAVLQPVLEITALTIPSPAPVGYELGDTITLNIFDRYGAQPEFVVDGVAGGTGGDKHWLIKTNSVGSNYRPGLKVAVVDAGAIQQQLTYTLDSNGGIAVTQITPNTTWAAPTVAVGGQGAYGTVSISSKQVTSFVVTAGGINYLGDYVLEFYSDVGLTTKLAGNIPTVSYTVNGDGVISAITVGAYAGYFDVANGTYYYKVVERFGSGADLQVVNYKYITSVAVTYAGEFTDDIKLDRITMTTDGAGITWLADVTYDLKQVDIVEPGRAYTDPTMVLSGGNPTPPTVNLTTSTDDSIYRINVVNGGAGYSDATVEIIGDGIGAVATANIVSNKIDSITLSNGGTGYKNAVAHILSNTGGGALLTVDLIEVGGIKTATIV